MSIVRKFAVLVLVMSLASTAKAVIVASDNASSLPYDDGWQTGDNGGFGFGAWAFSTPAGTSAFTGDSTSNGGGGGPGINTTIGADGNGPTTPRSWGLSSDGATIDPVRSIPTMTLNSTFRLSMDNGFINNAGDPQPGVGEVGFNLRSGIDDRFQFFMAGNNTDYFIKDGSGFVDTGIVQTEAGLETAFTLTGLNTYSFTVINLGAATTNTFTGTLQNSGVINDVRVYAQNTYRGFAADAFKDYAYFNLMSEAVPEPSTVLLLGVGGLIVWRSRRKKSYLVANKLTMEG